IDLKGHHDEPRVAAVLEEVRLRAAEVKVLGSYPVGVL
ncbi:MAG: prephenate dehydratase, partial [Halomonas sp.]